MIIKISPNPNGSHTNQSVSLRIIPEGWIELPRHLEAEFIASGSFCDLTIEDGVLTGITPLPMPKPEPVPPAPMTTEELALDLLTDLNYRTTLLELGMTT